MKRVIKDKKKMKNTMYIVFGVFALALFGITMLNPSYAEEGLIIDDALDAIAESTVVSNPFPEGEESDVEENQTSGDEDITEPELNPDERLAEGDEIPQDLGDVNLEGDNDDKEEKEDENQEDKENEEVSNEVENDENETINEEDKQTTEEIEEPKNEDNNTNQENHGVSDEINDNGTGKEENLDNNEQEIVKDNNEGNAGNLTGEFGFKVEENEKIEEIQGEVIESEEIRGEESYEGVKVEVYAPEGAFPNGTILSIMPITGDDEMSDIQDVLEEQKNVEKTEKVIAFDITFLDPETNEELQPLTGTVQVSFNYEENEELKAAEQDEEQEVKVYHLNDKDEEGKKIEEIKDVVVEEVVINEEKSEDEGVMVIDAEKFSVYAIIKSNLEEIITITYNPNGGSFSGKAVNETVSVQYTRNASGLYVASGNTQSPNRVSENMSVQSGYMFDGWYTTATDQTTEWLGVESDTTSATKTVYAKWLPFNDKVITMGDVTFTIMDRNLGATDFSSGYSYYTDQTNLARAGKYYQFGNNYGFRNDVSYQPNTSQEKVDLSSYGTGNPYYNNIFRIGNESRDSSSYMGNQKIWGAYSDNDNDKQGPCPEGYHIPARDERNAVYNSFINRKSTDEGKSYCNNIGNGSKKYCIPAVLGLPLAGRINYTNASKNKWQWGMYYRSSDYSSNDSYFYTTTHWVGEGDIVSSISRAYGMSLRCFKNTYSKPLSFNANGGSVTTSINKLYRRYEGGQKLPIPTNTGMIFDGWYRTSNFQGNPVTINRFTEYESGGSVTLYAKRRDPADNKTVIYNANGGCFSGGELTKQAEYSEQVESGNYVGNINVQSPNKAGYMFDGWYTDTNYSTEWLGVTVDEPTIRMVYAKWLPFNDMEVTLSGTTITLMDRNLGATVVGGWNTAGSYGKYYQWGNNYGFSNDTSNIKTSNFLVDASGYGPGNYYYSPIFIKSTYSWGNGWQSKANFSLWNGEGPCPKGYHIPTITEWARLKDLFKSWMATSEGSSYCNALQYTSEGACFSEKLKIPIAGYYDSIMSYSSNNGYYWSTTHGSSSQTRNFSDYGLGNGAYIYTENMYPDNYAFPLRCFKDPSTTLTFVLDNGEDNFVLTGVKRREPLSNYKPKEPNKLGYGFEGWYDENGDRVDFSSSTYVSESKIIYARYLQNTGYIFDANGGEFENGDETVEIEIMLLNGIYVPNESLPIIKKNKTSYIGTDGRTHYTGWMFAGWYTTPVNQTTEWLGQTDSLSATTRRVYAKWLPFEDLEITMGGKTFTIMDRNLGAEDVAEGTYYGGNLHEDYSKLGFYYQWGNDYGFSNQGTLLNSGFSLASNKNHQDSPWGPGNYYYNGNFIKGSSSSYRWDVENNRNLWGGESSLNSDEDKQGPCPEGYHVPDKGEWQLVYDLFNIEKTNNIDFCTGDLNVIGKCLPVKLKLPFAGIRDYSDSNVKYQGQQGVYWSSTPGNNSIYSNDSYSYSYMAYFRNDYVNFNSIWYRTYGLPVRCFKNVSNTLILNPDNGGAATSLNVKWRESLSDYRLVNPVKKGYRFLGWYDGDNKFLFSGYLDAPKTLQAKWEKNPIYTYNATSGDFETGKEIIIQHEINEIKYSHTPNIDDDGNKLADYENNLKLNEVITIPGAESLYMTITYGGESCCDWVAMWTGSHPEYTAESNYYNPKSLLGGDGRLYGGNYTYTGNTQEYYVSGDTVTFAYKSDGGGCGGEGNGYGYYAIISDEALPRDKIYYTYETVTDPTRTGYIFLGWYESGATQPFDFTGTEVTQDRTFYAKWEANTYTVSFNANNGENNPENITVTYDSQYPELPVVNKTGYIFLGWYNGENVVSSGDIVQITGDVELKAKREINQYKIIFDTDGGNEINQIIQDYNTDIIVPNNPTKTGYTFSGWDKPIPSKMPAEDLIITAQWKINQYTITFDTDGGNEISTIKLDYKSELINLPTSTKECNTFSGWENVPERMPAHDITLKAIWNYTCSKSSGGGGRKSETTTREIAIDTNTENEHNSADEKENNIETSEVDKTTLNDETSNQVISVTQEVSEDGTVEAVVETVKIRNTDIVATVRTEVNQSNPSSSSSSSTTYTKEQKDAYSFAKSNGITTTRSIETAKMDTELTRIEMAKMVSNYAINVLGQEPDISKGTVQFKDVTDEMDKQYDDAVTKAYQLGIMGQNMNNNEFRPSDTVTRAEFTSALSRLLYHTEDGEYKGTGKYYIPHVAKLYNEGIVNKTNPKMKEKRGYVMTMLMRTVK